MRAATMGPLLSLNVDCVRFAPFRSPSVSVTSHVPSSQCLSCLSFCVSVWAPRLFHCISLCLCLCLILSTGLFVTLHSFQFLSPSFSLHF